MSLWGQIHIWRRIYLWLWVSVAIGWVWRLTPEGENMGHLYKFCLWGTVLDKTDAHVVLYISLKGALLYSNCNVHISCAYVNVLREQFWKVNGQLNKDRAKGKTLRGKHCWSSRRPCVKKPLKTRVKHPKCCNHYLDKDRTHIVLVNKSVPKTEPADKIFKGLIKVSWGTFWSWTWCINLHHHHRHGTWQENSPPSPLTVPLITSLLPFSSVSREYLAREILLLLLLFLLLTVMVIHSRWSTQ